jgi:hypothetical protein
LRSNWRENLINLAVSLSLHSSTSFNDALALPVSAASRFFESKTFADRQKERESEMKIHAAIVGRLNEVIRALGIVAKVSGGR